MGPAYGEDAAALRVGEQVLVASTDPITFAADRIGTLAVTIATNDIAACGATPRWIMPTLFVPEKSGATSAVTEESELDRIASQIDRAAHEIGAAIVGGHTEYADRAHPLVSTTCLGLANHYIPTGGADPGEEIVLTKSAAVEAGAILATDFEEPLAADLPEDVINAAAAGLDDTSVLPESVVLRERATAMHDPTEGGVLAGAIEMAVASGVSLELRREDVPLREAVAAVCREAEIDPLGTFGSGALLAAVPEGEGTEAVAGLESEGITVAVIGRVEASDEPGVRLDDVAFERAPTDEMYDLWE
ncbi:hydrogenase expression protein [Halobacteriales archaeon QS_3_64_16]|nr:MAG: hydrogenase expression protein [Halobacteriales archaeon QS_3_64_16]